MTNFRKTIFSLVSSVIALSAMTSSSTALTDEEAREAHLAIRQEMVPQFAEIRRQKDMEIKPIEMALQVVEEHLSPMHKQYREQLAARQAAVEAELAPHFEEMRRQIDEDAAVVGLQEKLKAAQEELYGRQAERMSAIDEKKAEKERLYQAFRANLPGFRAQEWQITEFDRAYHAPLQICEEELSRMSQRQADDSNVRHIRQELEEQREVLRARINACHQEEYRRKMEEASREIARQFPEMEVLRQQEIELRTRIFNIAFAGDLFAQAQKVQSDALDRHLAVERQRMEQLTDDLYAGSAAATSGTMLAWETLRGDLAKADEAAHNDLDGAQAAGPAG